MALARHLPCSGEIERQSQIRKREILMDRNKTVETTLGDLVLALTEQISPYVRDEKEACRYVAFMLTHLLNGSSGASRTWQYWQ
jgi:hypothetical protein